MTGEATQAPGPIAPAPRSTRLFAVGALVVAGAAITFLAAGGLGNNLVYYWGPKELAEAGPKAAGATIRLGGKVVPGSIQFEEGTSSLRFSVTDGAQQAAVHTRGVPPAMFREGIGVVIEGTATASGVFEGSRLMISHGNEYRAPKPGEKPDIKALIQSAEAAASAK